MADEDLVDGVKRWARLMNSRGHSSLFAKETEEDQAVIERATAEEWCAAVRDKYGLEVKHVVSNQDFKGVPDCFAYADGRKISIELTELVDGEFLDEIKASRRAGYNFSPFAESGFSRSQWDARRFSTHLERRIADKAKYARRGILVDVLIIHTDEPWLYPGDVEAWLPQSGLKPVECIASAYLLMTHVPGIRAWPVFRLW